MRSKKSKSAWFVDIMYYATLYQWLYTYTINILDKAQQLTRSAAHMWLAPGGGKTVLQFSLGCTDTRPQPSLNPKWSHISASYLVSISVNENFAAFAPISTLGCNSGSSVAGDLWRGEVCFLSKPWSLSVSCDHTHVHVRHIMVQRSELSAKSRESLFFGSLTACELCDELEWWVRVWRIDFSFHFCPQCE